MISLLPWYIYSRRIVCTCFNLMISLLPWYVYSGYEFIYKVYWKFYANHDISLLFVRIHFVFFRIAYPYFLDFLDIRVGTSLYTECTGNYVRIVYVSIIIAYPYFLDTRVDVSLYTRCTGNYVSRLFLYILCFNFIIAHYYFFDTHIINYMSLYIWYTRNYVRIVYTCFNLIIAYLYFFDTHVDLSLYIGCTENYMRIMIYRSYALCVLIL